MIINLNTVSIKEIILRTFIIDIENSKGVVKIFGVLRSLLFNISEFCMLFFFK